jgi:hydroxymethylglutaryl-CoA reductase
MDKYWTNFRNYHLVEKKQAINYQFDNYPIPENLGEQLIENFIGYYQLPIGVIPGIKINSKNYLVPLAIEESSVVAALSRLAKFSHNKIKLTCNSGQRILLGHCYFEAPSSNMIELLDQKNEDYLQRLNLYFPKIKMRQGEFKWIKHSLLFIKNQFVIKTELAINPAEAMGANSVTQACEKLGQWIAHDFELKLIMAILSNKSPKNIVYATMEYPEIEKELGRKIEQASLIAENDPYRAATHNKGIMNAIDPLMIITGNDWRANAACVYSSLSTNRISLSQWRMTESGLVGKLELSLQLGIVGGVTKIHPQSQFALNLMQIRSSNELCQVAGAIGLAQNYAALEALVTEGVMRGHMKLHQQNIELLKSLSLNNGSHPHTTGSTDTN